MEKATLEALVEQGLSTKSIAQFFDTSQTNIRYWVRKHGLKLKQKPFGAGYIPPKLPYRCGRCGESDPAKFYGHKRKICGSCQNAYNHKVGREKRLRAVRELGGRCFKCGFDRFSCSLDIHHKDPGEKDPNFRSLRGWSWEHILPELAKCVLLCKNCHAAVHAGLLQI